MTKITEYDATTKTETSRDLTNAELTQLKIDKAEAEAQEQNKTARQVARQAVLDKLGLTQDEAQALFG